MAKKTFVKKERKHKINGEVRFPEVRVIGSYNGQLMSSFEASKIAQEEGVDLILINENANPPIVRIEDYGKFIYDSERKEKEAKKNVHKTQLKEISLSVNIADHDLGIKAKKALEFLENGDKVKLSLLMKGRQMSMKENGEIVMLKFAHFVEELGLPEALPKLEGNRWNMIIKPKKK
jgi:translation initiation factor IF-3